MSDRFRFSRSGRGEADPWFRIGTLDVGTVMLVVLLSIVSVVVFAVEPLDKPVQTTIAMISDDVAHGQVWRLLTWPFANLFFTFWVAVNIFFFWYFGSELERTLGRVKMAVLFFGTAVLMGLAGMLIDLAVTGTFYMGGLAGLGTIGLLMTLVFIAENPHIRFFFGIPGWLVGVVLTGAQVVQLLGYRFLVDLYTFLASLVIVALVARAVGLLTEFAWIPRVPLPGIGRPRRPRQRRLSRRRRSGPTVVPGPWTGSTAAPAPSRDQQQLDALLDKISEQGMDSLSDRERQELLELRERLRKR